MTTVFIVAGALEKEMRSFGCYWEEGGTDIITRISLDDNCVNFCQVIYILNGFNPLIKNDNNNVQLKHSVGNTSLNSLYMGTEQLTS